jgi:succinyl-CoA synthetase beta subunit
MCGKLMSIPTNNRGVLCNSVLVYEKLEVLKEFFLSIDYDRKSMKPVITYSERGGMTLPQIERRYPETIH